MINNKARRHEGTEARRGCVVVYSSTTLAPPHRSSRAFSLIEVLLAIFILGIGIIGIAALFPAGIAQQQRSVDDIMGPLVANNALSVLRSKLSQDDFGSWEDFGFNYPPEYQQFAGGAQIPGDWLWRRPAVMYQDDPLTTDRDEAGAIDIFGFIGGDSNGFAMRGNASLGNVPAASDQTAFLPNSSLFPERPIPFNPAKWYNANLLPGQQVTPSIVFTQGERMYPMSDRVRNVGNYSQPQYYWDCMFRKFQGKVLVAIFVYRVTVPGGEEYRYSVPMDGDGSGAPIIPYRFDFANVSGQAMPWNTALNTWEINQTYFPDSTPTQIPETGPGGTYYNLGPNFNDASETTLFKAPGNAWQMTGQWFVDQNTNVLRVLSGREKPGEENRGRPIELVARIPAMQTPNSFSPAFASPFFYDRSPPTRFGTGSENVVTNIWYLPKYIEVNLGGSSITVSITPVFVTVEEL